MKTWKQKLSSRKLWAAIAGIVTGLAMVFGLDEGVIGSVAGAVVSVASVITYIVTEGRIDAAAVGKAAEQVQNVVELLGAPSEPSASGSDGERTSSEVTDACGKQEEGYGACEDEVGEVIEIMEENAPSSAADAAPSPQGEGNKAVD